MKMKVIGFGSPLRGDDGIGLAVLDRLRQQELPPHVELMDGGTGSLAMLEALTGYARGTAPDASPLPGRSGPGCLIVDAVEMGLEPGAVRVLDLDTEATLVIGTAATALSLHDADVGAALALARALGWPVRARIIAIQPADLSPGQGLTPKVADAVQEAVAATLKEIPRAQRAQRDQRPCTASRHREGARCQGPASQGA